MGIRRSFDEMCVRTLLFTIATIVDARLAANCAICSRIVAQRATVAVHAQESTSYIDRGQIHAPSTTYEVYTVASTH